MPLDLNENKTKSNGCSVYVNERMRIKVQARNAL